MQILCAYFVVLPLRDEGAISLGLSSLPGLFVGSLVLTSIAAPVATLIFSLPNVSKGKVCVYPPFAIYPVWIWSLKFLFLLKKQTEVAGSYQILISVSLHVAL